jgi:putative ABC transport system ATP-binding protein
VHNEVEQILELREIVKRYFIGESNELEVLRNISLKIADGEFVAIVGQSGSGKSTLMNIIGALDRPTEGLYLLDGTEIAEMTDNELAEIRNEKVGFVFQTFNLVAKINALSNVELPMFYKGTPKRERRERAAYLLSLVDMQDRMTHMPNELSGGQKQRVAIARALANEPSIILADEPTGNLDTETGEMVTDIFMKIHRDEKRTVLLITHNDELAKKAQRIVTIRDGRIISDEANLAAFERGSSV